MSQWCSKQVPFLLVPIHVPLSNILFGTYSFNTVLMLENIGLDPNVLLRGVFGSTMDLYFNDSGIELAERNRIYNNYNSYY